jgi:hypothetical protein
MTIEINLNIAKSYLFGTLGRVIGLMQMYFVLQV